MQKNVKEQVLEFMTEVDTSEMNSNEFVIEFTQRWLEVSEWIDNYTTVELFLKWPSVESITRSRRYIIKTHWIWVRTKADKEKDYIEEYALSNKF